MKNFLENPTVQALLTTIVIAVVSFLAEAAVTFFKAKTAEVKDKIRREELKKYISMAEDLVCAVVMTVQQTYVDAIKKSGLVLTDEQKAEAFGKARETILALMSDTARNAIIELYGDLNLWLEMKIESKVKEIKG
jgi:hypothetical protein